MVARINCSKACEPMCHGARIMEPLSGPVARKMWDGDTYKGDGDGDKGTRKPGDHGLNGGVEQ